MALVVFGLFYHATSIDYYDEHDLPGWPNAFYEIWRLPTKTPFPIYRCGVNEFNLDSFPHPKGRFNRRLATQKELVPLNIVVDRIKSPEPQLCTYVGEEKIWMNKTVACEEGDQLKPGKEEFLWKTGWNAAKFFNRNVLVRALGEAIPIDPSGEECKIGNESYCPDNLTLIDSDVHLMLLLGPGTIPPFAARVVVLKRDATGRAVLAMVQVDTRFVNEMRGEEWFDTPLGSRIVFGLLSHEYVHGLAGNPVDWFDHETGEEWTRPLCEFPIPHQEISQETILQTPAVHEVIKETFGVEHYGENSSCLSGASVDRNNKFHFVNRIHHESLMTTEVWGRHLLFDKLAWAEINDSGPYVVRGEAPYDAQLFLNVSAFHGEAYSGEVPYAPITEMLPESFFVMNRTSCSYDLKGYGSGSEWFDCERNGSHRCCGRQPWVDERRSGFCGDEVVGRVPLALVETSCLTEMSVLTGMTTCVMVGGDPTCLKTYCAENTLFVNVGDITYKCSDGEKIALGNGMSLECPEAWRACKSGY